MINSRFLKSKKVTAFITLTTLYVLVVNVNMVQRERLIQEHRSLSYGTSSTDCEIRPLADHITASDDATKTLLASYPGSGKKFTWSVISALTNHDVADDWNFSTKLELDTLTIKTSWPHREGVWSWGAMMDQVLLLVRNPRWAIPSYHTMRFELDYAGNWTESYVRIPYTYTERPALAYWEAWRDVRFDREMVIWAEFIDFWMQGGLETKGNTTEIHPRCIHSQIECKPKAVLDFDTLYQEHPTSEFFKIGNLLDSTANVELISAQARGCLLDKVFDEKLLHNAKRNGNGPVQSSYMFTTNQLELMYNTTVDLRDKYAAAPWDTDSLAEQLVFILNNYINQILPEYEAQKELEEAEEASP